MRKTTILTRDRLPFLAAGVLAVGAFALFLGESVGIRSWSDEWSFILYRRGISTHSLLMPHNEHFSLVPVLIYKALLQVAGLRHYAVFHVVAVLCHLAVAGVFLRLALLRLPAPWAVVAAVPVIFSGAGSSDIISPFQISYMIPVAAGLGAILLLERDGRRSELAAAGLLLVAIASSGIGLPFTIGAAACIAARGQWRRWWVVGVPLLVYGIWHLNYSPTAGTHLTPVDQVPKLIAEFAAAAVGGLTGLGLSWGRLGLAVIAVWVAWTVLRQGREPARLIAYVVTALVFWTMISLARGSIEIELDRYIYVGAVLIVLTIVELVPVPEPRLGRGFVLAAAAVTIAAVSGLAALSAQTFLHKDFSAKFEAEMRALEISRDVIDPNYNVDTERLATAFPAHLYFTTVDDFGSAAMTENEISKAGYAPGVLADRFLMAFEGVTPGAVPVPRRGGAAPNLVSQSAGSQSSASGCLRIDLPTAGSQAEISFAAPGVVIVAESGTAPSFGLRRLAPQYPLDPPPAAVSPETAIAVPVVRDRSTTPWKARISTTSRSVVRVCGLH